MTAEPRKVTLDKLIVHKFRHVAPGTSLTFDPGINVVLGRNGTGKTTLITLISSALRLDLGALCKEPFELEWEIAFRESRLRLWAKNEEIPGEIRPNQQGAVATPKASYALSYNAELFTLNDEPIIQVLWGKDQGFYLHGRLQSDIRPYPSYDFHRLLWMRFNEPNTEPSSSILDSHFSAFADAYALRNAYRFDEGLDIYDDMMGFPKREDRRVAPRPLVQVATFKGGGSTYMPTFVPYSMVPHFLRYLEERQARSSSDDGSEELSASKVPGDLTFSDEKLGFLKELANALGFASCEMTMRFIRREPEALGEEDTFGNPEFRFTKTDGSIISQDELSYGQRRMLAFLYYLDTNPFVAIADELVNGFHHEWIPGVRKLCGNRQAFLTSQNPLLLDELPLGDPDDVRRRFVSCKLKTSADGKECAIWRNFTEAEAEVFFHHRQTGFQSTSEALKMLGLW